MQPHALTLGLVLGSTAKRPPLQVIGATVTTASPREERKQGTTSSEPTRKASRTSRDGAPSDAVRAQANKPSATQAAALIMGPATPTPGRTSQANRTAGPQTSG